jgi:predicted GIY-YIG superfamily endonuclease
MSEANALADGTALYRIRGEEALLLYIGISDDFGRRWKEHAKQQPWWGEMRSLSVDCWYGTRSEAETAEELAIKAERPKYNKTHVAPSSMGHCQAAADAALEQMLAEGLVRVRSWIAEVPAGRRPLTSKQQAQLRRLLEER